MKFLMAAITATFGISSAFCAPTVAASFATIEHQNGSLLSLNEETLPFASGETFPLNPGDIIEFGRGFTAFSLIQEEPENLWQTQIFPGDSFASFCIAGKCIDTTPNAFLQLNTSLPSGEGNVIAYGFDSEDNPSVRLILLEAEFESVPEPNTMAAIILALISVGLFKAKSVLILSDSGISMVQ